MFFADGRRKTDFVIVYVNDKDSSEEVVKKRDDYEDNLRANGLQLEYDLEDVTGQSKVSVAKVHVPWNVCLQYAERMKLKVPLKVKRKRFLSKYKANSFGWDLSWLPCSCKHKYMAFIHVNSKAHKSNCFSAEFSRRQIQHFDIRDQRNLFSSAERSLFAYRVLSETRASEPGDIGIDKLLLDETYSAAFPLHEGEYDGRIYEGVTEEENIRRILYKYWAKWNQWYRFQPIALIKYYFGDKIGIYFAWLGYYTVALIAPSIVGIFCFLYSIVALGNHIPTREICEADFPNYVGNLTMCPLCDHMCSYWKLHTSCFAARVTYVFDNGYTIFFAVFMSMWATMFLEFWKRFRFRLAYQWDLVAYDDNDDLIRPEYEAALPKKRKNPITDEMEPYLSSINRYTRSAFSAVTVLFWIAIVIAAVCSIIVFKLVINLVYSATTKKEQASGIKIIVSPSFLTSASASLLSVLIIVLLNRIYVKVALWLTFLELPRTQLEFEDSFALKMFCFQFVNYYAYLFYIAFFKTAFAGHPSNYTYLFGKWRWDECDVGGCMYELTVQLFFIMFAKQMWNNVVEFVYPWALKKIGNLKSNWRKSRPRKSSIHYMKWDQYYQLYPLHQLYLFYEYLELVIQFGFITLFVAAFPLAPLLAFINNILEIRLDAHKFVCEYRRPVAQKINNIGIWYFLLDFLGTLAVVTNAFIIAITSQWIPKYVYYYSRAPELYGYSTLQGYVNDSLSVFNVSDFQPQNIPNDSNPFPNENVTECRYRDYRNPPGVEPKYEVTSLYWRIAAARLTFVVVMEHVVFFLKRLLDFLIPDRSRSLKDQIKNEHILVQNMLFKNSNHNEEINTSDVSFDELSRIVPRSSPISSSPIHLHEQSNVYNSSVLDHSVYADNEESQPNEEDLYYGDI